MYTMVCVQMWICCHRFLKNLCAGCGSLGWCTQKRVYRFAHDLHVADIQSAKTRESVRCQAVRRTSGAGCPVSQLYRHRAGGKAHTVQAGARALCYMVCPGPCICRNWSTSGRRTGKRGRRGGAGRMDQSRAGASRPENIPTPETTSQHSPRENTRFCPFAVFSPMAASGARGREALHRLHLRAVCR